MIEYENWYNINAGKINNEKLYYFRETSEKG
jgi:hypothetical protein